MADIFDYLNWRGDISFSADPFNEVDNLILAELAYTHFDGIVPKDGTYVSLEEVRDAYFACHSIDDIIRNTSPVAKAPLLMNPMLSGKRFSGVKMSNYVDIVDEEASAQFSALVFRLEDGTAYVAYRGTDSTIVGWKEDFNMSYLPVTEGQRMAAQYLDDLSDQIRVPIRLGGHSKGGNFAVYAAAFCTKDIRDRIINVYTNDGPGFRHEIMDSPEYAEMLGKIVSIVPDTSLIGMLLASKANHIIVSSSERGIMQHDALTWQVNRNRFVRAEMSELGDFMRQAQEGWLSRIDDESRESFVNSLFSLFEATGVDTFTEMGDQKLASLERVISAMQGLPRDKQLELLRIAGKLIQSSGEAALASVTDYFRPIENN